MNVSDYIQAGEIGLAIVVFGAAMLNRYAVANHNDRLARITSAAGNAAGDIRDQLNALPPGADAAAVKAQLVKNAVPLLATEFASSVKAIGATPEKLAGIISGQVGQIPPTPVGLAGTVTALEPMVGAALAPATADLSHAAVAAVADAVVGKLTMASASASVSRVTA